MRAESITECEELVYLESSAWGWLARTEFQDVIAKLKSKSCVVVSSISAAEALQNPNVHIRQRVCSVMCQVHSNEAPLLEPPLHLALKAGAAHRAGNNDFLFSESGPSPTLREAICGQRDAPVQEAYNWIQNMEQNAERFLEEIRPEQLDWETQYLDSRVLDRTDFLQLLAEYPPAKEANAMPTRPCTRSHRLRGNALLGRSASRLDACATQSVAACVPTETVGTRMTVPLVS